MGIMAMMGARGAPNKNLMQYELFPSDSIWRIVKDGYQPAAALYMRHYSYHQYRDNRRNAYGYRNRFLICGPGEKMVLMTPADDALFVWRKFISDDGQSGVNCAVFRNESGILSSNLILEAERMAAIRWKNERLYTYVNASAIASANPGYCFKMAGWKACGVTSTKKLIILEKYQ